MKTNHSLLLALILLLAGCTRFIGLDWDDTSHLHPDERFLTMVASAITLPSNPITYLSTQDSPANPHNRGFSFYVYGTYPMHLTKLVAQMIHRDTYDEIVLVGRALSGIADLITVLLVFCIGRYVTKRTHVGLLSALCYALSVVPIQLSHFFTVDPYVTMFTTFTLWHIVRRRIGFLTGIAVGLAISAKISAILILPVMVCSFISLWPWKGHTPDVKKKRSLLLFGGLMCILGMILTVRVAYPHLFTGLHLNPLILANWKQLASFDSPTTSFPPGLQWIHVSPRQPTLDIMAFGLGLPLSALTLMTIIRLIQTIRKKPRWNPTLFLLLWVLLALGYQSLQFAKPMRYFWSVYPALSVFAGITLYDILRFVSLRIHARYVQVTATMLIWVLILLWPMAFITIYTRPNTRVAASTWIYTHVPKASTIAWEHWDDPLPLSIKNHSIGEFKTIQLPMYNPDSKEKWQELAPMIAGADYIVLSSNRVYGGTGRVRDRFPQTTRYYALLFSGQLGFEKLTEFTSRPHINVPGMHLCLRPPGFSYGAAVHKVTPCSNSGLSFIDDYAEESFTVYDHPKVTIFKNIEHVNANTLIARIYE